MGHGRRPDECAGTVRVLWLFERVYLILDCIRRCILAGMSNKEGGELIPHPASLRKLRLSSLEPFNYYLDVPSFADNSSRWSVLLFSGVRKIVVANPSLECRAMDTQEFTYSAFRYQLAFRHWTDVSTEEASVPTQRRDSPRRL